MITERTLVEKCRRADQALAFALKSLANDVESLKELGHIDDTALEHLDKTLFRLSLNLSLRQGIYDREEERNG